MRLLFNFLDMIPPLIDTLFAIEKLPLSRSLSSEEANKVSCRDKLTQFTLMHNLRRGIAIA
jgi:hypothetical protein